MTNHENIRRGDESIYVKYLKFYFWILLIAKYSNSKHSQCCAYLMWMLMLVGWLLCTSHIIILYLVLLYRRVAEEFVASAMCSPHHIGQTTKTTFIIHIFAPSSHHQDWVKLMMLLCDFFTSSAAVKIISIFFCFYQLRNIHYKIFLLMF